MIGSKRNSVLSRLPTLHSASSRFGQTNSQRLPVVCENLSELKNEADLVSRYMLHADKDLLGAVMADSRTASRGSNSSSRSTNRSSVATELSLVALDEEGAILELRNVINEQSSPKSTKQVKRLVFEKEHLELFWRVLRKRLLRSYKSISAAFRAVDTSGEGKLSYSEFDAILTVVHLNIDTRLSKAVFADSTKGAGEMTFEQFRRCLLGLTIKQLSAFVAVIETNCRGMMTALNAFVSYLMMRSRSNMTRICLGFSKALTDESLWTVNSGCVAMVSKRAVRSMKRQMSTATKSTLGGAAPAVPSLVRSKTGATTGGGSRASDTSGDRCSASRSSDKSTANPARGDQSIAKSHFMEVVADAMCCCNTRLAMFSLLFNFVSRCGVSAYQQVAEMATGSSLKSGGSSRVPVSHERPSNETQCMTLHGRPAIDAVSRCVHIHDIIIVTTLLSSELSRWEKLRLIFQLVDDDRDGCLTLLDASHLFCMLKYWQAPLRGDAAHVTREHFSAGSLSLNQGMRLFEEFMDVLESLSVEALTEASESSRRCARRRSAHLGNNGGTSDVRSLKDDILVAEFASASRAASSSRVASTRGLESRGKSSVVLSQSDSDTCRPLGIPDIDPMVRTGSFRSTLARNRLRESAFSENLVALIEEGFTYLTLSDLDRVFTARPDLLEQLVAHNVDCRWLLPTEEPRRIAGIGSMILSGLRERQRNLFARLQASDISYLISLGHSMDAVLGNLKMFGLALAPGRRQVFPGPESNGSSAQSQSQGQGQVLVQGHDRPDQYLYDGQSALAVPLMSTSPLWWDTEGSIMSKAGEPVSFEDKALLPAGDYSRWNTAVNIMVSVPPKEGSQIRFLLAQSLGDPFSTGQVKSGHTSPVKSPQLGATASRQMTNNDPVNAGDSPFSQQRDSVALAVSSRSVLRAESDQQALVYELAPKTDQLLGSGASIAVCSVADRPLSRGSRGRVLVVSLLDIHEHRMQSAVETIRTRAESSIDKFRPKTLIKSKSTIFGSRNSTGAGSDGSVAGSRSVSRQNSMAFDQNSPPVGGSSTGSTSIHSTSLLKRRGSKSGGQFASTGGEIRLNEHGVYEVSLLQTNKAADFERYKVYASSMISEARGKI